MTEKSFTIQKVKIETIEKFHKDRAKLDLSGGAYLNLLVNAEKAPAEDTEKPNPHQINSLEAEIEDLKAQIEALKNKEPEVKEIALTGTQFIYEPSKLQYDQMRRSIAYMLKSAKITKEKATPSTFTEKAINYYLKNEFNHIL